jgi:hypothetical protein
MNFIFLSNTTIHQLTHISLCIIKFIGHTILLHVSAHGTSSCDTLTNLALLNYAFYMDSYNVFIIVCYNNLRKYNVLLSLLFNHLYMPRLYFILLSNVLNRYLNLLKVSIH